MDKQWLLVFLLQSSWLSVDGSVKQFLKITNGQMLKNFFGSVRLVKVNVANICERVGEDHFPDLGDQILQPESIRSNFNDFDTPRVRMTIYIYSLHSNSRVEFFQNSSIDLQICFSMMSNRSREIEITELLLQRNGNSLYEILHFGTRNYTIQNGTCAPWRSHQICCIRFPINSDWIEDILHVNLYGIQIRSLGVQGITVRNADTKIQNCKLQNPASSPQDLVILQDTCKEDQPPLIQFLFQNSCIITYVNVASICETEGKDHFPELGDRILQPESIRSNFNDFDTPRVRMTIYIYSLHNSSRVEFFQNSSIDLQICFSIMTDRSREIEITELLLQRNANSLYEILHSGTRNYIIQNGTCAPWRSRQICCIRFPINSDWIEDILHVNLYGIQIRSLGVQGITVRNVDTKIQNCRLQNPASNPQDLVILQNTCTEDQPPLIQFLFQNSCIIYEAEKGKEKNIIIFTSISLVFFIAVTALFSGILCFYLKLKRKINHVPNINLNADAEYAEIADNPPENKYKVHYINYAEEESSYNYGLLDEDHNEEESFYVMPPLEQEELYEQIRNAKIKLFSRDKIKLGKILGSGQFGEVYSGVLEGDKEVAVKTLKDASSSEDKIKFLQEAFIMSQFQDTNVVAMYGAVTDGEPIMLVIELLSEGDLRNHLQKLRYSEDRESLIDDHTLLSYCQQIVNGMVYLTAKHFVHRDLAARNILLSADGVCKIADFGMSRDLMYESYYVSHGGLIPIKWTAPEALNYKKYSTASDVWSYGAVMYEIWSIGCKPFEEVPNDKVLSLIESGYRLPPPRDCPRMIYKIMVECWHPSPSMRPTFLDIRGKLSLPDTKLLKREESNKSSASETSSFTNNPIN